MAGVNDLLKRRVSKMGRSVKALRREITEDQDLDTIVELADQIGEQADDLATRITKARRRQAKSK
jgi:hypothetical protein